mgnify:CR=1 FL=1
MNRRILPFMPPRLAASLVQPPAMSQPDRTPSETAARAPENTSENVPAIVLAAGRGQRMRPLTDSCPKPLLPVRGRPLLAWHLDALRAAGVRRFAINTGWLGRQVHEFARRYADQAAADASADSAALHWHVSREEIDFGHALETAGGIARALPWLCAGGAQVFWAVAGDIYAPDFVFDAQAAAHFAASGLLAQLWLAPNPPQHPAGDFALAAGGLAANEAAPGQPRYTFSALALYHRDLFAPPWCDIPPGNPQGQAAPLAPLLRAAAAAGRVGASLRSEEHTSELQSR